MSGQQTGTESLSTPRFVRVVGLKGSGKTTVAEGLIRTLRARGLQVGAAKSIGHERLSLDWDGTDTHRLADSGARVVVAVLPGQTARFERVDRPQTFEDIARLYPADTDYVVCEGALPYAKDGCTILCLEALGDLERALELRLGPVSCPIAVTGIAANEAEPGRSIGCRGSAVPLIDAQTDLGIQHITDLVVRPQQRP